MRILIGGDVVPTSDNWSFFCEPDLSALLGKELADYWLSCDYRLFNLECAITSSTERIHKNGPTLVAAEGCLDGIAALNPSVLLLANNHIMDAGKEGLNNLLDNLRKRNIKYIGAGEDNNHSNPYVILDGPEERIGIYVCCDYEFSAASDTNAGAHVFTEKSFDIVKHLKQNTDYVIVIYHGGKEYYRYPSPELQRKCHAFSNAGASLIICQHSHCIGAGEEYRGCRIIYGQGNFIFNKKHDEFWSTSLLVEVVIENGTKGFNIRYIPLVQTKAGTRLAAENEKDSILSDLKNRSAQINEPGFIENSFAAFSDSIMISYLYAFAGWNRYWAALDRKVFHGYFIKKHYSKKQLAAIWNYIATEAHREVVLEGIGKLAELRE